MSKPEYRNITEYRKIQIEQKRLEEKLDEIAAKRARKRREKNKYSYAMHTPKEAMRKLEERPRSRYPGPTKLDELATHIREESTVEFDELPISVPTLVKRRKY